MSKSTRLEHIPTCRLLLTAVGLTVISYFPTGYHQCVMNVAHEVFKRFINETYTRRYAGRDEELTSTELSTFWAVTVSSFQIGALFGSTNAFWIADRLGRTLTLTLITGVMQIIGVACMVLAIQFGYFELLVLGRFVSGTAAGVISIVLRLFIGECSPDRYRGTLNCLAGLTFTIAVLAGMALGLPQILGDGDKVKAQFLLGFCLPFYVVQVLVFPCFPETPKFLYLTRKDKAKAESSLVCYHGQKVDAKLIFEEWDEERALAGEEISFCQALRLRSVRLPLLLAAIAGVCDSSTGIDMVDNYSTEILNSMGMPSWDSKVCSVAINGAALIGALLCVLLIERCRRRRLLLSTLLVCFLVNLTMACLGAAVHFGWGHAKPVEEYGIAAATLLGVLECAYTTGPGGILEPLFVEVCPHRVRAVAGSISRVSSTTFKWLYAFVYPILEAYGGAAAFLVHTSFLAACTIYFFYQLPETGQQSVSQVLGNMLSRKSISDKSKKEKETESSGSSTTAAETAPAIGVGKPTGNAAAPIHPIERISPEHQHSGKSSPHRSNSSAGSDDTRGTTNTPGDEQWNMLGDVAK